ncbi:MAG TPA: Asp-tRNA(Asn)/Glu-tRNA(Gln) amidotransferase subunit GatB [Spirochaetia bacterium]|nr:Asp-tRNA(Asn)/Glu-tRNA(Gln) amidotransferase subunit GatB [Spirochaetia bacterium]
MKREIIIGVEVHVQLLTESKAFCGCANSFGGEPNSRVCPVCLGLPGSLPVPNRSMIEKAVIAGSALGCTIARLTKFDRKNYMYPDLPKAYQISQYDMPIASGGRLPVTVDGETAEIRIRRVHMEEDTGKNIHSAHGRKESGVDYNRSGTPLLEIVTEPDLRSPAQAAAFVTAIREIMRSLGVSDCNMEEGSLRCDANINLWIYEDDTTYATPIVEVKNMNSFKSIRQALEYETERQEDEWKETRRTLKAGGKTTRGWNEERGVTVLQRVKEEEADYRYFPEPDIRPIVLDDELINRLTAGMAELPAAKRERFLREYALSEAETEALVSTPGLAEYFEQTVAAKADPKKTANWLLSEVKKYLNEKGIDIPALTVPPAGVARLLALIEEGTISGKIAKEVFPAMADSRKDADTIVREQGLLQISDEKTLLKLIDQAVNANADSVSDFRQGKEKALKFLMGHVMKLSKGKANPVHAEELLRRRLTEQQ